MTTDDVREVETTPNGDGAEQPETAQAQGDTALLASSTVYYTSSTTVTPVHAGPSTSYTKVGDLPKHSGITIICQTQGQSKSGPYGTSTIWDKIGNGRYVPDSYVYTGSDGYVAPKC